MRAARSRSCGRIRRFSRTSSALTSTSSCSARWSCGGPGACRSPTPSSRSWTSPRSRRRHAGVGGLAAPGQGPLHTGRIVPVYERTGSVTTNMQRRFVSQALEQLPEVLFDPVPADLLTAHDWPSRRAALLQAHFPSSDTPIDALNRFETAGAAAIDLRGLLRLPDRSCAAPPRERAGAEGAGVHGRPTRSAPRRARCCRSSSRPASGRRVAEIVADMQRRWPMQRLLQGDVGAGKTIVALLAAIVAMENGYQVAFMAPTEILAEQHFRTVDALARRHAVPRRACSPGASPRRSGASCCRRSSAATSTFVIGTHALVQEHVAFRNAGARRHRRAASLRRGAARGAARPRAATRTCW